MTDESISSPGVSDGEDDEEGVEEYPTAVPSSGTGKSSRSSSEHQKVSSVSTRASPGDRDLELGVSPPSGGNDGSRFFRLRMCCQVNELR